MCLMFSIFVFVEFLTLVWLFRGGQQFSAGIVLAIVICLIWAWEFASLLETSRKFARQNPAIRVRSLLLMYVLIWIVQVGAAAVFYIATRVHRLPVAFELFAAHVALSAVFHLIWNFIQGFLDKSKFMTINDELWWDSSRFFAAVSPICGLISILACKALGVF